MVEDACDMIFGYFREQNDAPDKETLISKEEQYGPFKLTIFYKEVFAANGLS